MTGHDSPHQRSPHLVIPENAGAFIRDLATAAQHELAPGYLLTQVPWRQGWGILLSSAHPGAGRGPGRQVRKFVGDRSP